MGPGPNDARLSGATVGPFRAHWLPLSEAPLPLHCPLPRCHLPGYSTVSQHRSGLSTSSELRARAHATPKAASTDCHLVSSISFALCATRPAEPRGGSNDLRRKTWQAGKAALRIRPGGRGWRACCGKDPFARTNGRQARRTFHVMPPRAGSQTCCRCRQQRCLP